jgi:hypothetical protein
VKNDKLSVELDVAIRRFYNQETADELIRRLEELERIAANPPSAKEG